MSRARVSEALDALARHREIEDAKPATLFDLEARRIAEREAQRDVDRAVDRVTANALAHWNDVALDVVRQLADEGRDFTVVDVRGRLTDEPAIDWRALGGVLRQAQRLGWIEHACRYVPGPASTHHGRPLAVWRARPRGDR